VTEAAARYKLPLPEIPGAVLTAVAARRWPGNVRELRNAADRFALGLDLDLGAAATVETGGTTLADRMAEHEKSLIAAALTAQGGSLKDTYEVLGLSRKALYEKMQKHGLSRDDFAADE
jgi:two-component system C4-dicarboxylate transport response regulator DctD